jgi:hypothetical protein
VDNKAAANLLRMSASKLRNIYSEKMDPLLYEHVSVKLRSISSKSVENSALRNNFQIEGAKDFWKLIDSLLDEHVSITKEHILAASKTTDLNYEYLRQIYPDIDNLIQESIPDIQTYTEKFYSAGKTAGFTDMGVKAFTGAADTNAMFHLTNYNFGLIRKLTDDLADGVRREVWQGVARDRGMKEIAKRIEKVKDLQPITHGKRTWTIAERAKLQAITESSRARHQGIYMSYADYGVEEFNLLNSGGNVCKFCKNRAASGPYKINDKIAWPPLHPVCACFTEPVANPGQVVKDPSSPDEYLDMVTGEMFPVNKALSFSI